MGTNYYLHTNVCEHCGREEDRIHIGKSSMGWTFGLHVQNESWRDDYERIESLDDWRKLWSVPGNVIRDEYGTVVQPEAMEKIILERYGQEPKDKPSEFSGYSSWEEALRRNGAEWGPKHLWRRKLSSWVVGHGDGTYDLCIGDYS